MSIMMALGSFQFSINTAQYQNLKTSMSWRWNTLNRVGRKPARQFQGAGTNTKTLSISIYPESSKDLTIIQTLSNLGDTGKPQRLIAGAIRSIDNVISGSGLDLGLWTMDRLDVDESYFLDNGIALEIKGNLTISGYGQDKN